RLQVFEVSEASPAESHGLFLSDAVQKAPGFTELSLEDLGGAGVPGSRLEYLVDTLKGQPDVGGWHVVDERFEAADGKLYAVAAYAPDGEGREAGRELLRTALSGFCPPATTCGTGGGWPETASWGVPRCDRTLTARAFSPRKFPSSVTPRTSGRESRMLSA